MFDDSCFLETFTKLKGSFSAQSYSNIDTRIRFDFDVEKGTVKCDEITRNGHLNWLRDHNGQKCGRKC